MKILRPRNLHLAVLLATGGAFAACGSSAGSTFTPIFVAPDVDSGAPIFSGDSGPPKYIFTEDASAPQGALAIAPLTPALTVVSGQPLPTQLFTATLGGEPTSAV